MKIQLHFKRWLPMVWDFLYCAWGDLIWSRDEYEDGARSLCIGPIYIEWGGDNRQRRQ